jgi:replication-associated recombination protein RarA
MIIAAEAAEFYGYPHDFPERHVPQQYLPDELVDARFYKPKLIGPEIEINRLYMVRLIEKEVSPTPREKS